MKSLVCIVGVAVAIVYLGTDALVAGEAKSKLTLADAYRKWYTGFASKKKEDREKALRSMLPNEKDIEYLFPKHAKKLLPLFAKGDEFLVENVDRMADEITHKGVELESVKTIDVRTDKDMAKQYKKILEIIPKRVPVFEISVRRKDGSGSSGGSYLFLKERWIWIKDLDAFPPALDNLDGK
jgi:hypothetical protein